MTERIVSALLFILGFTAVVVGSVALAIGLLRAIA